MKSTFERSLIFLMFITFMFEFSIFPNQLQNQSKLTQKDFEKQLLRALDANDESQITTFIASDRYLLHFVIDRLLDSSVVDDLAENSFDSQEKLAKVGRLATLYQKKNSWESCSHRAI